MTQKGKDTLSIYKRILLVEKIKDVEYDIHGHRYWYDKKGIYNNREVINICPILINYPCGGYKSFYPESVVYHLYWEKLEKKDVCHIYEEKPDNSENNRYVYYSTKYL